MAGKFARETVLRELSRQWGKRRQKGEREKGGGRARGKDRKKGGGRERQGRWKRGRNQSLRTVGSAETPRGASRRRRRTDEMVGIRRRKEN